MVVASTSAASQSTADGSTLVSNVDEEQLARRSEALPARPNSPSPSHHKQKQKHKRQDTDSKDAKKSFFKKARTEEDEKRLAQAMYKEQQAAMRLVYSQEDEDEDIKKSLLEQIKSEGMTQARAKALHQDQQATMRRIVDDEYADDDDASVEETDDSLSESEDEDAGRTASKASFTAPPEDATQTIAIEVTLLQKALWHMNDQGRRTWTGRNKEWEDTFQLEPTESKTRWLKRQGKCVKEEKSRKLLKHLYNLNELCAAIPEGSDKKQNTFLREHADGFRCATHKAYHWADNVTTEMECLPENGEIPDEDEKTRHELLERQLQLERLVEQPRRAIMAAENDRRIKAQRVAEERRRAEESKRHSDAWKSIQGRGTFPPSKSPAAATAHPDYYKKWGWFYEEDKQLLGILEKGQVINLASVARSFPGRSPTDLQWRILELKRRQRPKYVEKSGSEPPEWLGDDYHEFSV
ncbi:hypothetical protein N3K66_008779 [Trichothecium roseum]|uniref:Uncharacterized protein n=1 Tax=Trichothecium roseum TaxID=47278 RepID=A0ACC0USW0_9HYPO|nr:hypothetical protein N3K66_008779 [Trichothecium roseum]